MYELGIVRRTITRADRTATDRLAAFGSATVHEAMGRVGLMHPSIRPIYAGAQASGTAVTVLLHPGDNWMLHVAAEQIQPGDIVVAGLIRGMLRRLLRRSARDLVQGARRARTRDRCRSARRQDADRDGLSGLEQVHLGPGNDQGDDRLGQRPVVCAGALVTPGDAIVADDDGVVCVPSARVAAVADAAAREANEGAKRAKLASGVLGLDMYGMREPLAKAGLRYVD